MTEADVFNQPFCQILVNVSIEPVFQLDFAILNNILFFAVSRLKLQYIQNGL